MVVSDCLQESAQAMVAMISYEVFSLLGIL